MYNLRVVNETDGEELWYGNGEFMTLRRDAQDFESSEMAVKVAEGITAGMCFIGSAIDEDDMDNSDSTAFNFEEVQVVKGNEVIGKVDVYEKD